MRSFRFKSFPLFLLLIFLLFFSSIDPCNARRGKHWNPKRTNAASLTKKKGKSGSGGSGGHGGNRGHSTKSPPPPPPQPGKKYPNGKAVIIDVLAFGAKGDGVTDDTKAFQAAWAAACKVEASTVVVPAKFKFLVGPISFAGPYCQPNIVFQLEGMIIAPMSAKPWGSGLLQWLEFTKLKGITIRGGGIIDGRGSPWWNDAQNWDPALRFYGSFNVTVTGIKIQNSPQCHLKFDNCVNVLVTNMTISSPGSSLNTDGIHLQNSRDVLIHHSDLACGDDCVSIQTGCSNIYIHNLNCGPGHGISIGGLGKDNTKACVSNVTVKDIVMHGTMTAARIKTWQGGSGSVQDVLFSNIQVSEVEFPIIIDQFYCDRRTCKNQTSAVALSGITYEKIKGTYTVKPVHLACSDGMPCIDVTLIDIELHPVQEGYHLYEPFCWKTFGELLTPSVPPIDCLQIGKPSSSRIQSNHDSC